MFQEDGDRGYIETLGDEMKVINLSARVVNGLTQLNGERFRNLAIIDHKFIKALLICCVGTKNLFEDNLDAISVAFIKGNALY